MKSSWSALSGVAMALFLTSMPARAGFVTWSATDLGGGLFEYDLTLHNPYSVPVSGLNLLHANTEFGLDQFSMITAPPGWDFFAPLPPLVDELNYFSLSPANDVAPLGALGGFSFQSTRDPSTVTDSAFAADLINGLTGKQIPIPEPNPEFLAGGVLLVLALVRGAAARRLPPWNLRAFSSSRRSRA